MARRGGGGRRPGRGSAGRLAVREAGGGTFELVHPACVLEREDDYEEALEAWQAGEPDEAREMLRYALEGCGDNLWVHVALGRLALEVDRDPTLARGHFGYAFALARRALPPGFAGRLPMDRPANRPVFGAIDGLIACAEAQGRRDEVEELRRFRDRIGGA
jgi:hypothetical protein